VSHYNPFDRMATIEDAEREYVRNVGSERPEVEWILSDRDCWYRNPYFTGKPGRHPEDYAVDGDDDPTTEERPLSRNPADYPDDDDIPF
jgi:hypothetical protein